MSSEPSYWRAVRGVKLIFGIIFPGLFNRFNEKRVNECSRVTARESIKARESVTASNDQVERKKNSSCKNRSSWREARRIL